MISEVGLHELRHRPVLRTCAYVCAAELLDVTRTAVPRLYAEAARQGLTLPRPIYLRYHGALSHPHGRTGVEMCLPFDPDGAHPGQLPEDMDVLGADPRQYATTRLTGADTAHPAILRGYDAVARWMDVHCLAREYPAIEIYWRWTGEPGDAGNDLQVGFPVGR